MFKDVDIEKILIEFIDKILHLRSDVKYDKLDKIIIYTNDAKEYEILSCSYCKLDEVAFEKFKS